MILFEYLDYLPRIPEKFNALVEGEKVDMSWHKSETYHWYKCEEELKQWVRENIKPVLSYEIKKIGLQEMTADILPHKDLSRPFALNYLFRTGDGILSLYNSNHVYKSGFIGLDKVTEIKRVSVEPFRWHIINTSVLHGVSNIKTPRMSLTIDVV